MTVIGSGYDMVVDGNKCERGREFADHETSNPKRTLTTTVRTKFPGVPVISVRTAGEIPRDKLMDAMKELNDVIVGEEMNCGDTLLEDVAKTGVSVIVTSFALMQLGAELENRNTELGRHGVSGDSGADMDPNSGFGDSAEISAGALDDIGADAAGGFVGAAGEAVGVEDSFEEDEEDAADGDARIRPRGRPHIKRR
jgi:CxxC motif-containing protein